MANLIFTLGNVVIYDVVNNNQSCFLYLYTIFSSKQLDGAQMLANNNTPIILPSVCHRAPGSSFFLHISLPGTSTITMCKGQSLKPTLKDCSFGVEAASRYQKRKVCFSQQIFLSQCPRDLGKCSSAFLSQVLDSKLNLKTFAVANCQFSLEDSLIFK